MNLSMLCPWNNEGLSLKLYLFCDAQLALLMQ